MESWTESAFSDEVDEGPRIVLETVKQLLRLPLPSLKLYL